MTRFWFASAPLPGHLDRRGYEVVQVSIKVTRTESCSMIDLYTDRSRERTLL